MQIVLDVLSTPPVPCQHTLADTETVVSVDQGCGTQNPAAIELETVSADMETMTGSTYVSVGVQVYSDKKNARVQARPISFSVGRKSIPCCKFRHISILFSRCADGVQK